MLWGLSDFFTTFSVLSIVDVGKMAKKNCPHEESSQNMSA